MNARDWLRLLLLSLVWGGTFLFVSLALRGTPGIHTCASSAWRWPRLVSGYSLSRPAGGCLATADSGEQFLISGLITNAIPFSLITWEQTQVEGGIAAVMNALTPCFVVVLAHFFTKDEKASVRKAAGVLVGFLGAYVLLSPEIHGGVSMRGLGMMAGLTASVAHASASIYGKRFTGLSPLVAATGMLTGATLWLLPVSLIVDRPWETVQTNVVAAGAIGALGLGTVVAYLLYYRILRSAGATNLMLARSWDPSGPPSSAQSLSERRSTPRQSPVRLSSS